MGSCAERRPGGAAGGGGTPFWFRSNGSETFEHDWVAGDIILRTRDGADGTGNGAGSNGPGGPGTGNGHGNFVWTSPLDGIVTLVCTIWKGQPVSQFHRLILTQNGLPIGDNSFASNVYYTRANPFITQIPQLAVLRDDPIEWRLENANPAQASRGGYFGVNLNIIVCIGVTRQPSHALACPGGSTSVSVQARTSYGTLTYRWRKNGVPLLEDGGGGRFHGVFGPTLSITNMTAAEAGSFDCVLGSVCSAMPSDAATVSFCRADFDCSGALNVQDVFDFLNTWFAQDPRAEFDQMPGLGMGDIVEFVNTWFAGCG